MLSLVELISFLFCIYCRPKRTKKRDSAKEDLTEHLYILFPVLNLIFDVQSCFLI